MTKMIKTKINGRWDLILPDHRAARPEWDIANGGWEKARLDSIFKTTKKGDVVYYVGAEEGDMCALLTMWGAEMYLFEPNDKVWPNIKAIYDANKLPAPNRSYIAFAANETTDDVLYNRQWPVDYVMDGEIIGNHGFKNLCEADGTVPKIKIDDLALTGMGKVPDMISIDVEGAEWEVLRGAEQTLRKYHPRIYLSLHPEFLFHIYGEYSNDLRQWLKNMGYKETFLDYQHEVHLLYEANDE